MTVARSLKILQPRMPRALLGRTRTNTALFWFGVTSVVVGLVFSPNVLAVMHADVLKLLPSTYIALVGGLLALSQMALHQRSREAPGLLLFVFAVPLLGLYSAYWQGFSGSLVYVESYWIAGLLALMLEPASAKQKRLLGGILIAICLINVLVAVDESLTQTNWFPLVIDPSLDPNDIPVEDFRANGFYSHPLNASLITAMAFFLLYTMRLKFVVAAPIFAMLLVGLLAFGGRVALGVTLVVSALTAVYLLFRGLFRRDLKIDFVLSISFAIIVVPIVIAIIATQTSIADRIMDNLYYDDSAATRATQWQVLSYLNLRNWLFGIPHVDLDILKYQIGLGGKDTDIENFWLLMFLNLGLIGFLIFIVVLGIFLFHLGRHANCLNGWLLILSSGLIDSTSNSLGVRSNDLFIEVAFVVAITGYRDVVPIRGLRRVSGRRLGRLTASALSKVPVRGPTIEVR